MGLKGGLKFFVDRRRKVAISNSVESITFTAWKSGGRLTTVRVCQLMLGREVVGLRAEITVIHDTSFNSFALLIERSSRRRTSLFISRS